MSDSESQAETEKPKQEPTYSDRGFAFFEPTLTDYGATIQISESSAASGPHLWLRTEQPPPEYPGALKEASTSAHMTLKQAEEIRDKLDAAIELTKKHWA
jgi:hypothetical protein